MPGKECAHLPPELWGEIAARLPHDAWGDWANHPNLRLVCKAACRGSDDVCKRLDIWDLCRTDRPNPTGAEITALAARLPGLRICTFDWHDRAGFVEAAEAVERLAEEKGLVARVLSARVRCGYARGRAHSTHFDANHDSITVGGIADYVTNHNPDTSVKATAVLVPPSTLGFPWRSVLT